MDTRRKAGSPGWILALNAGVVLFAVVLAVVVVAAGWFALQVFEDLRLESTCGADAEKDLVATVPLTAIAGGPASEPFCDSGSYYSLVSDPDPEGAVVRQRAEADGWQVVHDRVHEDGWSPCLAKAGDDWRRVEMRMRYDADAALDWVEVSLRETRACGDAPKPAGVDTQ